MCWHAPPPLPQAPPSPVLSLGLLSCNAGSGDVVGLGWTVNGPL